LVALAYRGKTLFMVALVVADIQTAQAVKVSTAVPEEVELRAQPELVFLVETAGVVQTPRQRRVMLLAVVDAVVALLQVQQVLVANLEFGGLCNESSCH
jgi:hypothetical protein